MTKALKNPPPKPKRAPRGKPTGVYTLSQDVLDLIAKTAEARSKPKSHVVEGLIRMGIEYLEHLEYQRQRPDPDVAAAFIERLDLDKDQAALVAYLDAMGEPAEGESLAAGCLRLLQLKEPGPPLKHTLVDPAQHPDWLALSTDEQRRRVDAVLEEVGCERVTRGTDGSASAEATPIEESDLTEETRVVVLDADLPAEASMDQRMGRKRAKR